MRGARTMNIYSLNGMAGVCAYLNIGKNTQNTKDVVNGFNAALNNAQKIEKNGGLYNNLNTMYPEIKYHILDTSKIQQGLWARTDYPFEKYFENNVDNSILDWQPTGKEPSRIDSGVQARLNATVGKKAVLIPSALEEKMTNDPALAAKVSKTLSAFIAKEDAALPYIRKSFLISLDEDGNISHSRVVSEGGELILPSEKELQEIKKRKKEKIKREEAQREQYEISLEKRRLEQRIPEQKDYQQQIVCRQSIRFNKVR
jgi:hypothetical protein